MDIEHLFHGPFGYLYFFFGKMSIQILCLIFHHIVSAVDVIALHKVFGYQFFIIIFSHSVRLTFEFVDYISFGELSQFPERRIRAIMIQNPSGKP